MLLKGKLSHDETGRDAALPGGAAPLLASSSSAAKLTCAFLVAFISATSLLATSLPIPASLESLLPLQGCAGDGFINGFLPHGFPTGLPLPGPPSPRCLPCPSRWQRGQERSAGSGGVLGAPGVQPAAPVLSPSCSRACWWHGARCATQGDTTRGVHTAGWGQEL